jgi:cell wall-associated NlpC family hydrolase
MENDQRAAVVAAARGFIGTRYRRGAAVKGVGMDCATMISLAFTEAGARPPIVIKPYSSQWHLHSTEPLYEQAIEDNGGKLIDVPQVGDIVLYFQGLQFAHGAIVTGTGPLRIIHAYAPARCVVEGFETEFGLLTGEQKKFFSAW